MELGDVLLEELEIKQTLAKNPIEYTKRSIVMLSFVILDYKSHIFFYTHCRRSLCMNQHYVVLFLLQVIPKGVLRLVLCLIAR